ncbi:MAG: hypothetical protein ACOY0T_32700 [Myxococcota bacterium]
MQQAAVIVRGPNGRCFVRADSAQQIVPQPTLSHVPSSELCIALVAGRIVSVVEVAGSSGALLVCDLDGELVGFSGLAIERVGMFELDAGGAHVDDDVLPELFPAELLRRALGAQAKEPSDEPD